MSKISIIGGDYIETTGGDNLLFAKGNIINSSELEVRQKGKENGVSYGTNKEAPLISNYIEDAYWASDNSGTKIITEANLGDDVYFVIKFKKLAPNLDKISFKLYELIDSHFILLSGFLPYYVSERGEKISLVYISDDKNLKENEERTTLKEYDSEKIENNRAVINFKIGETGIIKELLLKEKSLQLYFRVQYDFENKKLPSEENKFLKVDRPKIKDGKLILVQASEAHPLPELYDSLTGDLFRIGKEYGKNITYSSKVTKLGFPTNEPNGLEKKVYTMVIGRLEKGELISNTGKLTSAKDVFARPINDLDGKFSETIKIGVASSDKISTRGINQFEAMLQNGRTGIAMKVVKLSSVAGDLVTLTDMMIKSANGDKMDIPFMPPFVTSIVAREYEEYYDDFYQIFLAKLNRAMATGNLTDVEKVFVDNRDENVRKGYDLIFVTDEEMAKILDNTIKYKNELAYSNRSSPTKNNGLVVQYIETKDEYGREVYVYYIHTIFVSKLLTENK